MENYWNKMQQKFIEGGEYPQQLPVQPLQTSINMQQIPKASNPYPQPNPYNNPYSYQDSNFQRMEQFDGIIDPPKTSSNQGHYGFNKGGEKTLLEEIKEMIKENMDSQAKMLCAGTCVIWLIILIMIFKQF